MTDGEDYLAALEMFWQQINSQNMPDGDRLLARGGWIAYARGKTSVAADLPILPELAEERASLTAEQNLFICIDPLNSCSCYNGEGSDECAHGRQHQALDSEA